MGEDRFKSMIRWWKRLTVTRAVGVNVRVKVEGGEGGEEEGLETRKARYKPTGLPRKRARKRGGKVKTIAHNWHMKFKEARARRRGWKGQSLTQYTHATVFEPLFFSLPSSSLEIYISSLLELLNYLFIPLSFKEPLVAIPPTLLPSPSNLPDGLTSPTHPPTRPPLPSFRILFPSPSRQPSSHASFLLSFPVPSPIAVSHEPAATSSSSLYTETILYLRRDYASLADNRKYAVE